MQSAECIECGGAVVFGETIVVGEIAQCGDCGVELEVLAAAPLAVGLAPEIEEDWGE